MLKHILLSTVASIFPRSFDNKAGWKVDADGKLVMQDGNPVYVGSDGKEMTVANDTISRLNGEAQQHREIAKGLIEKLKPFEGIDPVAAKKAIETVGKLDAKKLIDAGEIDRVKAEISGQFTAQIAEKDKAITTLGGELDSLKLGFAFKSSDFIRDKVAIPADMFESYFKTNFKIENGAPVPYGTDGNKIFSSKRVGETATIDEALEQLVERHPQKALILKAPNQSGSGNNGNGGGRGNNGQTINRSDFEKLTPVDQATIAGKAQKGEVKIVD